MTIPKMTVDEVQSAFRVRFKGKPNFMTPAKLGFGQEGKYIWELSTNGNSSRDVFGAKYGVTVLEIGPFIADKTTFSECFDTREEAETYIKTLGV